MVRRGFSPFQCVFTRADHQSTAVRFFPLTAARGTPDIKAVQAMVDVLNMTGNTHLQFGYWESDDPENFTGAAQVLDVNFSRTSDGFAGMAGYVTPTFTKAYVVFGVLVRNNTNDALRVECCWVSARFDTRAC